VYDARLPTVAGEWSVVVDGASGEALRVEPESLAATGRVFNVNPIVATRDPSLRDNRLSLDGPAFADAYVEVEVANVTGPFFASERVIVSDALALPGTVPSYEFERHDPRFLETMVYAYVEMALDEIARAGYPDLIDYRIDARAHHPVFQSGVFVSPALYPDAYAGNGQITFLYRALTPGGPGFGSAAEDAEIIVHELGHLVHFAAAPDASGPWRYIWGEGNGDLLAALVLEPRSGGFGDPCVSEWLATYYENVIELFPYEDLLCIRVLENDLRMPDDFFGDLTYQWAHENGQFWSGALWDVRLQIGREETLTLFLESLHFMPAKADGFEDLGRTVLLADLGLTGGARESIIRDAFARKGIDLPTMEDVARAEGVALAPAAAVEPDDAQVPALAPLVGAAAVALVAALARGRRRG